MRRRLIAILTVAAVLRPALASADPGDGGPFRRTTPRAAFERDAGGLVLGIPSGRAWGIESGLHPLEPGARVSLTLTVDDPEVAEAFVRVAYYARDDARSRQLATADSPLVRVGERREVAIDLEPPPGAVAYRIRVLGRLVADAALSRADAIRARWSIPLATRPAERGRPRPSLTRLESDRW